MNYTFSPNKHDNILANCFYNVLSKTFCLTCLFLSKICYSFGIYTPLLFLFCAVCESASPSENLMKWDVDINSFFYMIKDHNEIHI